MNPTELEKAFLKGDEERVVCFFEHASEADRASVAPLVQEWLDGLEAVRLSSWKEKTGPELPRKFRQCRSSLPVHLAALAVLSIAKLRRQNFFPPSTEHALAVLRDRRPEWLDEFATFLCEGELTRWNYHRWQLARAVVREGMAAKPAHENYVLGMIVGISGRQDDPPLEEALLKDPALLEDEVWRLFEIDGAGEASLATHDKYTQDDRTWSAGLLKLCELGKLPRPKLLDASLGALKRDFPQFRSGWYSRFHEDLKPTVVERTERLGDYFQLLNSAIPPTVSFALKAIQVVEKAQPLTAEQLKQHIGAALLAKAKAVVVGGLKLLAAGAKREPAFAAEAARLSVPAILHGSVEVQSAVLNFLERHASADDQALKQALEEVAPSVLPSLQARLACWVGVPQVAPAPAGPPAREVRSGAIVPIATFDELVDRAAFVLENPEHIDDVERVLAGIARFSRQPCGPLRKHCETTIQRAGTRDFHLARAMVAATVLAWLDGETKLHNIAGNIARRTHPVYEFLTARLEALLARAAQGITTPLLSAPTHTGGWIDPRVLLERADTSDIYDQVLAILRLRNGAVPPTGRTDEFGCAIRFALGGSVPIGPTLPLWIAAARVRCPGADCAELQQAQPKLGPDAAEAARMQTGMPSQTHRYSEHGKQKSFTWHTLTIQVEPKLPRSVPVAHLPVLLHRQNYYHSMEDPAAIRWMATMCLHQSEPFFAMGALELEKIMNYSVAGSDSANAIFLEPLFQPQIAFGPMAAVALAIGLASENGDCAIQAREALAATIEHQRLDRELFGSTMRWLLGNGDIKPTRWAGQLAEVARLSVQHSEAVRDVLTLMLRGDSQKPPRDVHALLALLVEVLSATKSKLTDSAALAYLSKIETGGKTAKLIRQLVERSQYHVRGA